MSCRDLPIRWVLPGTVVDQFRAMAAPGKAPIRVPNPHGGQEISVDLLARVLRDSGIDCDSWIKA